jgi:hypothetical protein
MKNRMPSATNHSKARKLQQRGVNANLFLKAYREGSIDLLTELLEQRKQALAMARLMSARILELLSLPVVRTISKPGEEPEEVFQNLRAMFHAGRLMRESRLLWETVLSPLAIALEAMLAADLMGEVNEAAEMMAHEVSAGDVQPSNATKCNVLHGNSVLCGAEAPTGDPTGKGEEQGGRKEQETKAA